MINEKGRLTTIFSQNELIQVRVDSIESIIPYADRVFIEYEDGEKKEYPVTWSSVRNYLV